MILKRQMETRLGEEFEKHAEGKEDTDTGIYITSSASFERKGGKYYKN